MFKISWLKQRFSWTIQSKRGIPSLYQRTNKQCILNHLIEVTVCSVSPCGHQMQPLHNSVSSSKAAASSGLFQNVDHCERTLTMITIKLPPSVNYTSGGFWLQVNDILLARFALVASPSVRDTPGRDNRSKARFLFYSRGEGVVDMLDTELNKFLLYSSSNLAGRLTEVYGAYQMAWWRQKLQQQLYT